MLTMKRTTVACLLLASLGSLAAAPSTRGKERAAERLAAVAAEHVRILTELQAKLPEQARADLTKAIEAASAGHESALAVLGRTLPPTTPAAPATPAEAVAPAPTEAVPPAGTAPAVVGIDKARQQMAIAFETSHVTLEGVMARVPERASQAVAEALARIDLNRAAALERFDRLVAAERPARPEHPVPPDRPEVVERVEHPAHPDRPEPPRP